MISPTKLWFSKFNANPVRQDLQRQARVHHQKKVFDLYHPLRYLFPHHHHEQKESQLELRNSRRWGSNPRPWGLEISEKIRATRSTDWATPAGLIDHVQCLNLLLTMDGWIGLSIYILSTTERLATSECTSNGVVVKVRRQPILRKKDY